MLCKMNSTLLLYPSLKNFVVGDNSIIVNGKEGYVYAEDEAQLITKSFAEAVRMQVC